MTEELEQDPLPPPIVVPCQDADTDELLGREWLIANKLGAYASATVLGTNTRRYHGLLAAATAPPAGRVMTLSCLLDRLILPGDGRDETVFDLATFEFVGTFTPDGRANLVEFRNDVAATFVYRCGRAELIKEVILADAANAVAVRYRMPSGPAGRLRICPFVALRGYHELRRADDRGRMTYLHYHDGIRVEERAPGAEGEAPPGRGASRGLHLTVACRGQSGFQPDPQWWYRFRYRAELARGYEGLEDLYTPGAFEAAIEPGKAVQLTASLDDPKEVNFAATTDQKRRRLVRIVEGLGEQAEETDRRLAAAGDAFVVSRQRPNAHPATTLVAGYPWFADWGRDAMIALPGLLLETHRLTEAGEVLRLFASAEEDGLVPNFLNACGEPPGFNSIDASLWFVVAAERFLDAGGDTALWRNELSPSVQRILSAYRDGTRHDIRADADGLLAGGEAGTQLTWMDAEVTGPEGRRPVTPRHGKCVEVNALWHAALRIAGRHCAEGAVFADLAESVAAAFAPTFWNPQAGCLYDCICGDEKDASVRPNQILAVALPDSPLPPEQQRAVVDVVRRELLVPLGLRTLAPTDGRYRGRYGGSPESRDLAYHQGTAWAWLIGPFIEAWLKVNGSLPGAREQAWRWLEAFDAHLAQAGIGYVSEIFDGDRPHTPRGCIAQAWSVGEVLRARRLVANRSRSSWRL